ncbi:hypothetical protein T12_9773, partial [Trichinella patagoniensis]
LFVNNGWRELKETPSINWKIPCQAIIDRRAIEISVSTNHVWRERKETTRANFRQKAEQHTPLASIKVAVAGERAQFSFDVVFSAMIVLRPSCNHSHHCYDKINIGRRELKETLLSNWKILCIPITFGVSEKRLRGYIFDQKPSKTPTA